MQIAACRFGILSLGIILLTGTAVQTAHGAGFRIPEVSNTGLATSDALVANPNEFGALPYNPAAMSYHEVLGISAGLILISPNVTATPTGSGSTDSNASSIIPVPNLYAMGKIQPDWAWGIGVNSPFGLETKWAGGSFPQFGIISPLLAPLEPEETKIEMININPNVAYKIDSIHSSVALGVDYYNVMDAVLNTQGIGIQGDGNGWGWNAAYLYTEGPFSAGLSFRSKVKVEIDGTFDPSAIGIAPTSMKTDVTFPEMIQAGARYQVLPALSLEFDVERTGWDTNKQLVISHSSATIPPSPYVETSNWNDVMAYRFGGIYELNQAMKVLFGYSYDNTPQGDDHFTPRLPDSDRQSFSVGLAYATGRWAFDAGYMYVRFQDRKFFSSTPFLGGDPNGTTVYNGTYETYGNLFGFSIKFII